MTDLTHLSLFSGIGGLDLAAEWAGFRTVGQCEWADYPTKVLEKHWPDVPRWRDIRTLTGDSFYDKTGLHTVTVISGGFPCQPFSFAGKRRGKADNRFLWPEMLRVISEIRPSWVFGENVAGIINLALDDVYSALENKGYAVQAFIIPACAVGAPHRRDRVFIVAWNADSKISRPVGGIQKGQDAESAGIYTYVAYTDGSGHVDRKNEKHSTETGQHAQCQSVRCDTFDSDTDNGSRVVRWDGELPAIAKAERTGTDNRGRAPEYVAGEWWSTEPDVGRVAHGIPYRVDRLKCLGNAVVPAQAYPIFWAITELEKGQAL
jgi:DNA (cytosine-5)-methyltransferase 1